MCLDPLKGFIDENGKVLCVKNYKVKAVYWQDGWRSIYDERDYSLLAQQHSDYIDMPCRRCPECYAQIRKQWISRAVCEAQNYPNNMLFLTLTYDDEFVPIEKFVNDDGEILYHNVLRYSDVQKFLKRLRKRFSDRKIKFLCGCEYGGITHRPHYHLILYGLNLLDFTGLELYKYNKYNQPIYTSVLMQEVWKNGICTLGDCNINTVAYVAGYVAGKVEGFVKKADRIFDSRNYSIFRPFVRSSLGLGAEWFRSNLGEFQSIDDYKCLPFGDESVKIKLTDNWKRIFEEEVIYGSKYNREADMLCSFDQLSQYKKNRIDRRVKLIDPINSNLKTDCLPPERRDALINHFRKSCNRKKRSQV